MGLRLPWPLPAVIVWAIGWLVYLGGARLGLTPGTALGCAVLAGLLLSLTGSTGWRRLIMAAGFPVSLMGSGAAVVPAAVWLLMLVVLLLFYPFKAWRDAPLFPTPAGALDGLPAQLPLPAGALVLDAGCGLGAGLRALHAAYPQVLLHGLEWSWPLRGACALRCRWARVRHGDIWQADWKPYAMVYLFQRPESMARAAAKAGAQMRDGAWLVSLEFPIAGQQADIEQSLPNGRSLWAYRLPFVTDTMDLTAATRQA
ncbi:MAG: class I SAM-dependent methyltransferase [Burkholderiaceae bacterium]